MLSEKMLQELNKQINEEIYSAYLYQAMSAHAEDRGLPGTAGWLDNQAKEEMIHARKIYDYIIERGGRIKLMGIEEPPQEHGEILDIFKAALSHEEHITERINHLVSMARKEDDFATDNFLQWFVAEQVEEESSVTAVLDKLELIDGHVGGIFQLDKELGSRTQPAEE